MLQSFIDLGLNYLIVGTCITYIVCLFPVVLVLGSMARKAELQTASQLRNSLDRIYFTDINVSVQAFDRATSEKTEVNVQKSVEVKSQVDQKYLQTVPTPGYPTTVKQDASGRTDLPRVYLQHQPALIINDPHYFGNRYIDDIQVFRPAGQVPLQNYAPEQGQLTQGQLQPQPQREQSEVFNGQVQPIRPPVRQNLDKQQDSETSERNKYISGQNTQTPLPIQTTQTIEGNAPVLRAVANFGLNLLRVRLKQNDCHVHKLKMLLK